MTDGLFSTGFGYGIPKYNEYIVARTVDTSVPFVADPDWRTTPGDLLLYDGQGEPVERFQIPNLPGRPAGGLGFMLVGIDADGNEVDPTGGTADVEPMEVISYSGDYNDFVPHVSSVCVATNTAALATAPIAGTVDFNRVARLPDIGGAQNQFVLRMTALTPPAGAVLVRLLIKGLRT